jgi:hypothetical protein
MIHKEKSNKLQQCIKNFIIIYLYEAQHVSGDTPPIIRILKLHWQPLVFHTWKVVGRVVGGLCKAVPDNVHQLHVQQPFTYEKPETASAVLGSWWWAVSPETCWASYKYGIIKFWYIFASCWIFLYELYHDARIHEHKILFMCMNFVGAFKGTGREMKACTFSA